MRIKTWGTWRPTNWETKLSQKDDMPEGRMLWIRKQIWNIKHSQRKTIAKKLEEHEDLKGKKKHEEEEESLGVAIIMRRRMTQKSTSSLSGMWRSNVGEVPIWLQVAELAKSPTWCARLENFRVANMDVLLFHTIHGTVLLIIVEIDWNKIGEIINEMKMNEKLSSDEILDCHKSPA